MTWVSVSFAHKWPLELSFRGKLFTLIAFQSLYLITFTWIGIIPSTSASWVPPSSSYRAVLPVADNLLQVGGRVKQEVLPPFVPVHGHSAIDIDTVQGQTEDVDISTTFTSFSRKKLETFIGRTQAKHHKLGPTNKSNLSNNRNYGCFTDLHFLTLPFFSQ